MLNFISVVIQITTIKWTTFYTKSSNSVNTTMPFIKEMANGVLVA
jgi:hypothetical protein